MSCVFWRLIGRHRPLSETPIAAFSIIQCRATVPTEYLPWTLSVWWHSVYVRWLVRFQCVNGALYCVACEIVVDFLYESKRVCIIIDTDTSWNYLTHLYVWTMDIINRLSVHSLCQEGMAFLITMHRYRISLQCICFGGFIDLYFQQYMYICVSIFNTFFQSLLGCNFAWSEKFIQKGLSLKFLLSQHQHITVTS